VLRAGDALRVLERRAPQEAIAVDEGATVISVFDYGAGNLRSVQNTLGAIGAEYELIRDAAGIQKATKLILPGVGHFGQMMRALDDLQVRNALIERIRAGVPFLGICLGLQGLFESSEEAPEAFSRRPSHPTHGLESGAALPLQYPALRRGVLVFRA
jgi:hypothetical protein